MADDTGISVRIGADVSELKAGLDETTAALRQVANDGLAAFQGAARQAGNVWDEAGRSIQRSMNAALLGILNGSTNLRSQMRSIAIQIESAFLTSIERILIRWLLAETAKTTATEAGVAERAAAETTAQGTSLAGLIGDALKFIATEAAKTFAGVFAFLAPEMGPAAAGPAAASEAAVLAASGPLLAFDVGAWRVPRDTLAMVHQGETIMPAGFAEGFRAATAGAGGAAPTIVYAPVIQALDASGVDAVLSRHGLAFARTVAQAFRDNPSLRPR